jgi:hypothetical protein
MPANENFYRAVDSIASTAIDRIKAQAILMFDMMMVKIEIELTRLKTIKLCENAKRFPASHPNERKKVEISGRIHHINV